MDDSLILAGQFLKMTLVGENVDGGCLAGFPGSCVVENICRLYVDAVYVGLVINYNFEGNQADGKFV